VSCAGAGGGVAWRRAVEVEVGASLYASCVVGGVVVVCVVVASAVLGGRVGGSCAVVGVVVICRVVSVFAFRPEGCVSCDVVVVVGVCCGSFVGLSVFGVVLCRVWVCGLCGVWCVVRVLCCVVLEWGWVCDWVW